MKFLAVLVLLSIVTVWCVLLRRRVNPLLLAPVFVLTLIALDTPILVLMNLVATHVGGHLFGAVVLMTLAFLGAARPSRRLFLVLAVWMGVTAFAPTRGTAPQFMLYVHLLIGLKLAAVAMIVFIDRWRPELFHGPAGTGRPTPPSDVP